jgi:hypothetical protein
MGDFFEGDHARVDLNPIGPEEKSCRVDEF